MPSRTLVSLAAGALAVGAMWSPSSPAKPLPKNSVMISNATLNPVPVYECAVPAGEGSNKMIAGALAYEEAWRCMYYNETAPNSLSFVGPGVYQVYTDSFNDAKQVQATAQTPFPDGTIVPFYAAYQYATGCQTVYTEIIGGFPYYFPAYGTALPGKDGNFVCHGASFQLRQTGNFVNGGLPYAIATDN